MEADFGVEIAAKEREATDAQTRLREATAELAEARREAERLRRLGEEVAEVEREERHLGRVIASDATQGEREGQVLEQQVHSLRKRIEAAESLEQELQTELRSLYTRIRGEREETSSSPSMEEDEGRRRREKEVLYRRLIARVCGIEVKDVDVRLTGLLQSLQGSSKSDGNDPPPSSTSPLPSKTESTTTEEERGGEGEGEVERVERFIDGLSAEDWQGQKDEVMRDPHHPSSPPSEASQEPSSSSIITPDPSETGVMTGTKTSSTGPLPPSEQPVERQGSMSKDD
ncbi:hypothetical protein BJ684DRAFT_19768 [Piptocephalis cylindrospora]|uniref:Uncharacterized protein n=1 Tax=Piptocephalis cylindrospora TaxID=1907219 RepID=A0A4P9Y484_9FUNG|nr:hypothetical protein BJ684DRAFT_19768 [Piptocephalis cylindrospora]|eukprot:RKP13776.1 hypothetical protein BJ684DRAFT_19768 [Piptocephalis cylindrospora]